MGKGKRRASDRLSAESSRGGHLVADVPDNRQAGAAALEFATLMLLLIVLVFGIVDMGRTVLAKIAVDDAVRHGVTYAVLTEDATPESIQERVRYTARGVDLSSTPVAVSCTDAPSDRGRSIRVEVSVVYHQRLITPIASWLSEPLTIESSHSLERLVAGTPCA